MHTNKNISFFDNQWFQTLKLGERKRKNVLFFLKTVVRKEIAAVWARITIKFYLICNNMVKGRVRV